MVLPDLGHVSSLATCARRWPGGLVLRGGWICALIAGRCWWPAHSPRTLLRRAAVCTAYHWP